MTSHYSSEEQSSDDLIEEVMARLLERAQRIDAAWENGPNGWCIVRGNAIKIIVGFDLPDDAQSFIEARCKDSVELAQFTRVITHNKRRVIVLFEPLRHQF